MNLEFAKYQGTGNDFILIDNRDGKIALSRAQVAWLCHRRFGIGADGLMLLETAAGQDFRMVYYNADGGESTMCGNGGRCIAAFARKLGVVADKARFIAIDGLHQAFFGAGGTVSLQMKDVGDIRHLEGYSLLDTGSPHYVAWKEDLSAVPVFEEGRRIRNLPEFAPGGLNVNFTRRRGSEELDVRTYERGVEDETYSCGTGVTAAAIAHSGAATGSFSIGISTPGGLLRVRFDKSSADKAENVLLEGPASFVFEGRVTIPEPVPPVFNLKA
jgi:diaminopimelate epimerase